jgi:hypothetical protein
MPLSTAERLMHATVRLECYLKDGQISTGTGFFFSFSLDSNKHIPLIVTNKHGCGQNPLLVVRNGNPPPKT